MFDQVKTRLGARVPELAGRIHLADDFSRLMAENRLPTHSLTAYLVPVGLTGQTPNAGAGAFVQPFQDVLGVVLFLRAIDQTGRRALERLDDFLMDVITAIAGWAPSDVVGVYQLKTARLIRSTQGALAYQIDFSINNELRIFT